MCTEAFMMMMMIWMTEQHPMILWLCRMMNGDRDKSWCVKQEVRKGKDIIDIEIIQDYSIINLTVILFPGQPHIGQLDNNLPFGSFVSKTARLNSECSNPNLQENCIVGQKWRCYYEDGQWRKHKCKFHVSYFTFRTIRICLIKTEIVNFQAQLQDHLAAIKRFTTQTTQTKRNCACFTPEGVVYTKMKAKRNYDRKNHLRLMTMRRHKRDAPEEDVDLRERTEEVYRMDMPSEMHYLLHLSRAIDDVRLTILNEKPASRDRVKRETVDHIGAVIQVGVKQ